MGTKFKIGNVIRFKQDHVKPGTSRIGIVEGIITTDLGFYTKLTKSVLIRHGSEWNEIDKFIDGCALYEDAKIVSQVRTRLGNLLYA